MNGTALTPLPEGLEAMAAGPDLLSALESVVPSALSGHDTVDFTVAVHRLLNHMHGMLLTAVAETGIAEQPFTTDRAAHPDPDFGADEIRPALMWTRTAAEGWLWLAWDLRERLPEVQAALLSGRLDLPRARIFSDWTMDLPEAAARAVVAVLLPAAHRWTTGQLIDEIKRLAVAVDPDWARRRYESKLTGRKVIARRNPDGTANLGGYDLPVERVAAAAARVDGLAKAARRAGHPDVLDHIRADLYLGLIDGEYAAMTDEQILADLIAAGEQKKAAAVARPRAEGDTPPADPAPAGTPSGRGEGDTPPADPAPAGTPPAGSPPTTPTGRGVEVRVRLATMLGLDRHPGELAGWGHIHAELAERLVAEHTGAQWRFVITDDAGFAIHTGLLRARPAGTPRRGVGVVEIQVHASLLDGPLHGGRWEPVIAELRGHLRDAIDRTGDRDKRVPGPALRRFLEVRNRTCVFPGCRMPASHADMDHSTEHGRGGETVDGNLAPLCRHDHRGRHERRWGVSQPEPGHVTWTSPLGKTYHVPAQPVMPPLPDPVAPSDKDTYDFTRPDGAHDEDILEPQAPRPPPPRPAPIDDEDPPF